VFAENFCRRSGGRIKCDVSAWCAGRRSVAARAEVAVGGVDDRGEPGVEEEAERGEQQHDGAQRGRRRLRRELVGHARLQGLAQVDVAAKVRAAPAHQQDHGRGDREAHAHPRQHLSTREDEAAKIIQLKISIPGTHARGGVWGV